MNTKPTALRPATAALALVLSLAALPSAHAQGVPGQGTWETTLQPRDLDNNGSVDAFYDTQLDITWLKDADLNGAMSWGDAVNWASSLNLGNSNGWRLPKQNDFSNGCTDNFVGTNCGFNVDNSQSELSSLFYSKLGNFAAVDTLGNVQPSGYGITNAGPFVKLQSFAYWTGQTDTQGTGVNGAICELANTCAYYFDFGFGAQQIEAKSEQFYAMVVHDGDIGLAPIPEPGTWALMLGGLALTVGAARRRQAAKALGTGGRG